MRSRILFCVVGILVVFASVGVSAQGVVENLITWNPISEPGVTEVLIYRSTTEDIGDLVLVATVSSATSSYTDTYETGAVAGTRYYYRLRSRNSVGSVSGFSTQMSARYVTPSCPAEYHSECRINSVVAGGSSQWTVDWSTGLPSFCRLEYWKMGTSEIIVTENEVSASTDHSAVLNGLDPESIYFIRAIARSEDHRDMTVSCDFSFVTSTSQATLELVVDPRSLDIDEGGTGSFTVRLSSVPSSDVTISAARLTGDDDITVSAGGTLVFTPMDWYLDRTVVLAADEDVDEDDGQAVIRVEGVSGPEVDLVDIEVTEVDNDTGDSNNGNLAAAMIAIYPMPYQPTNGSLTIGNLPLSGRAGIFDLRGQKVWNESWDGSDTIEWTGVNDHGVSVASGRYFLVITSADGQISEKRVILVVN